MAVTKDDVVEFLKGMTLLEASELVKELEEVFGVSAAAAAAPMMPPATVGNSVMAPRPPVTPTMGVGGAGSMLPGGPGTAPPSSGGAAGGTSVVMPPVAPPVAPPAGGAMAADPGAPAANCLEAVTDYSAAGPYMFMKEMSGVIHIWVPMVPAGCKVPRR